MKYSIFIIILIFFSISCDRQGDKLKVNNNSPYYIRTFVSDTNHSLRNAIGCGPMDPYTRNNRIGIINGYWEDYLKEVHKAKLYFVIGELKNQEIIIDTSKSVKIIYIDKDTLDIINWTLEYP